MSFFQNPANIAYLNPPSPSAHDTNILISPMNGGSFGGPSSPFRRPAVKPLVLASPKFHRNDPHARGLMSTRSAFGSISPSIDMTTPSHSGSRTHSNFSYGSPSTCSEATTTSTPRSMQDLASQLRSAKARKVKPMAQRGKLGHLDDSLANALRSPRRTQ